MTDELPGVLIATGSWDAEPWAAPFRRASNRPVATRPDQIDPASIGYVLAWNPQPGLLEKLPNLKAVFSLGAGVDRILTSGALPEVPLVRIVDPNLTGRMVEWVVLQVLLHHRRHLDYSRQQRAHVWLPLEQPPASAVRVGLLGLGVLGSACADALKALGFRVAGWSRSAKQIPGIEAFHGEAGLDTMLRRTDILVSLLPLTTATRGVLNRGLFERLAADGALGGPILINAGRGGLQVEADIVAALADGTLHGASLDVFEPEPLSRDSLLWDHPRVVITPHVSAASDAGVLAEGILRQIVAFEAGETLPNLVDRKRGY